MSAARLRARWPPTSKLSSERHRRGDMKDVPAPLAAPRSRTGCTARPAARSLAGGTPKASVSPVHAIDLLRVQRACWLAVRRAVRLDRLVCGGGRLDDARPSSRSSRRLRPAKQGGRAEAHVCVAARRVSVSGSPRVPSSTKCCAMLAQAYSNSAARPARGSSFITTPGSIGYTGRARASSPCPPE